MTGIPAFLINLDRSPDRLEAAAEALEPLGLNVTRIAAVDGTRVALPETDVGAARHSGRPLGVAQIGSSLSHLIAVRRFLDSGAPHALVFEDDLALAPDAVDDLAALLDLVGQGGLPPFDVINLGRRPGKFARTLDLLPSGRRLVRAHYFPDTALALLWSQAGARRFEQVHDLSLPVDVLLQSRISGTGRGLACMPALFDASGATGMDDETSSGPSQVALRQRLGIYTRAARGWLAHAE